MNITSTISNQLARQSVQRLDRELVEKRPKLPNNTYPQEIYHPYGGNPPYEHRIREDNRVVLELLQTAGETSLSELVQAKNEQAQGASVQASILGLASLTLASISTGLFALGQSLPGAIGLGAAVAVGGYAFAVAGGTGETAREAQLLGLWDKGLQNPTAHRNPINVSVRNFAEVYEYEKEILKRRS